MSESAPHEVIDLTNIDSDSDSEDDIQVPPLDEEAHTQLHIAIAALDQVLLRQIIADLVDEEPYIARALYDRLAGDDSSDSDEEHSSTGSSAGEDHAHPPPPVPATEPVLVPTVETCVNCDESFDVGTERVDGECRYHPGRLEVNETMFVDWDEGPHGPMDTEANRREFPENFKWSCCAEDGRNKGCREDQHEAGGSSKKRARISEA